MPSPRQGKAMTRYAWCGILLPLLAPAAAPAQPPKQQLAPEVVAAWKKAGAEVGWMAPQPYGLLWFDGGAQGAPGELPAFRLPQWKAGDVAKLPAPEGAFGL